MNEKDKQRMESLGITRTTKEVYSYKGHKYDRLEDALRYAEVDARSDAKTRR